MNMNTEGEPLLRLRRLALLTESCLVGPGLRARPGGPYPTMYMGCQFKRWEVHAYREQLEDKI
jgi:hypothetical protein